MLHPSAQRQALAALSVPEDRIYLDKGLTGTGRARLGLDQALAAVRTGDTLVVPNLDRLARSVPDELLAHISPAHSENINLFGVITVDVEAELAELDGAGWRPLRPSAMDLTTLP